MVELTPSIHGRWLSGCDLLTWLLLVPQDDLLTSSTPSSTTPLLTLPWRLHSSSSLDKLYSSLQYMCRLLCSKSLSASHYHSHVTWVFPRVLSTCTTQLKTFFNKCVGRKLGILRRLRRNWWCHKVPPGAMYRWSWEGWWVHQLIGEEIIIVKLYWT